VILGYAMRSAIRVMRRDSSFNPYFVALFATWIAYLIQAGISINQIGVGIWGWLFTGALIGYEIATREVEAGQGSKASKKVDTQLPASAALLGILGFAIGAFLSIIPFNADAKYKEALQAANLSEQFERAKAFGATAFHLNLTLDAAIKANDVTLATEITSVLLDRYPRDYMGWRAKQVLATSTPEERGLAYRRLKELDPYNPEIQLTG